MALEDTNEAHHLRHDTRDAHTNTATTPPYTVQIR